MMTDGVGTTKFGSDEAGNLDFEEGPWTNSVMSYSYHASAPRLRTGFTLQQPSSNRTQTWTHDEAHRVDALTSSAGDFVYHYHSGVDGGGRATMLVQQLDLPGGAAIVNDFDLCGRQTWALLYDSSNVLLNDGDGLGRMRKCINYTWSGTRIATGETRYPYDGRRVIQERKKSNVPTVSYARGVDLSGTFEGGEFAEFLAGRRDGLARV